MFVVIAAAIAILGAGVAWATIPGSNGRITACMLKDGSGTIRLIDAAVRQCKTTEKQIQWNAAGSVGAKFASWSDGAGGAGHKALANGVETPLLTLPLPVGFASGDVVATATVLLTNWLDVPVWGGCGVYSQYGNADAWPFTLTHGFNPISFQVKVNGTRGPLTLRCNLNAVGFLGNPDANGRVWAERASLSAVPVATP